MEKEKRNVNYIQKISRILLKAILYIFLFIILIFILVLTPPVQHFLTGKVQNYLQNKLKTKVEIGSISFGLLGKINLEKVYIEDRTKDTLLAGGAIKGHINFLKLFSGEVDIKDLELQNITAKIKRELPDTIFNFQFIADAFISEKSKSADTAKTAPLKLDISDISLDNIKISFKDIITGSDLYARIGSMSATIDTLDPYTPRLYMPTLIVRNLQAHVKQSKPLLLPVPLSQDIAKASSPVSTRLFFGNIDLSSIFVQYDNDVSSVYSTTNIGQLKLTGKTFDLENNKIYLDQLALNHSKIYVRFGKAPLARSAIKEVNNKVEAQKTKGWDFKILKLRLDNNNVQFDNDNNPKLNAGMDFSHLLTDSVSLFADNFVMNPDSVGLNIIKGTLHDKSGFRLTALKGDILYGQKETYLRNFYIRTPGSELRRNLELQYASPDALMKDISKTVINIQLEDSRIQVKDILAFAPQLRSNPSLSNPDDVWYINLNGSGTLDRLSIQNLQFSGLKNTRINARGTLVGLTNPQYAGGNFTIYNFHTSQSDIALFTGKKLSASQFNLPEQIDANGTIIGNSGTLNAALNMNTSDGFLGLKGRFSNITNPKSISYQANVRTRNLRLGRILRQQGSMGNISADFIINGHGMGNAMSTNFKGLITNINYNNYTYRNIQLNGFLHQSTFSVTTAVHDPNIDLDLTASGNYSGNGSYKINGMVDSIKTQPLHFTTDPLIFRGKIDGSLSNLASAEPEANILVTKGLFVSADTRLSLDTVQLLAGKNDTANYLRFRSSIANLYLVGQYRLADLGKIIQNTIEPYFTVSGPNKISNIPSYNFRFTADVVYNPILNSFLPGLTAMQPLHAEGSFATNGGMQAYLTSPYINYQGNEITNASVHSNTGDSGLFLSANIAHLKSGNSFDIYNTRVSATANHNNIDFKLGIGDQHLRTKYLLAGTLSQPSKGNYSLNLKSDSLVLNYQKWSVAADNRITFGSTSITASDFVLQNGSQKLSINSLPSSGSQPLQLNFSGFRLATLTGFVKTDSLLADGIINGDITFRNLLQQPLFTSNLTINDLSLRKDTLGNVNIRVNNENERYNTDVALTGRGNDVTISGFFAPSGNDINLNLALNVKQLQLHTMEGAMASAITNASGSVNGTVQIRGTTARPVVLGDLNFNKASFALSALGSQFYLDNQKLSVTENGFGFNKFTIQDSARNTLIIDGNIATANFINYNFNLDINAKDFEVLNSKKAKGKIYYGRLNISSVMHISGNESLPVVEGNLTVNDKTNLYIIIPQGDPGIEERQGIVQFVNMKAPENDSLFRRYDSLNKANVSGLDITANITISKEATFNIIVDEANGDFLNVKGQAQLSAGIDQSGKITLVGTYVLEQGSYELSFNFIKRKFDIRKGSTITWTGDPTSALLNVTAVYIANTAPLDLVQEQVAASTAAIRNTYLQKLPFEVHLTLTGELLKPVIAFDIILPEDKNYGVSNDIVTEVQTRLSQLREDQGEINKQVFSLLLLGRFVGQNPFQSSSSANLNTYARQSVSKLLTDQLNQLASGLINGVDLNFDVVSTDDYTTGDRRDRTDLNVGISKRLLNDRLKVTVGSDFELQGPQNSNQQNNNLAGNIAADYQVSKDGRYVLRFYRKNQYEGVIDGYIIETGLGFIITLDYNTFSEIIHRRKQRVTTANGSNQNQPAK